MQEKNVAMGGDLYEELHVLPGVCDHRSDKSLPYEQRYQPRHRIHVKDDTALASMLRKMGESSCDFSDNANYITKRLDNKKWREMKFSAANPNYYCLVVFPEYGDTYAIQETLGKSGLRSDFITYGAEQYRRPLFGDQVTIRPNASSLIKKAVTIPVHSGIDRETCNKIISILNGVEF